MDILDIIEQDNVLWLIPDPATEAYEALRKCDDAVVSMQKWQKKLNETYWMQNAIKNAMKLKECGCKMP